MYTAGIRKGAIPLNLSMTGPLPNLRDYYKFFVVRHPLDRLASAYKDKVENLFNSPIAKEVKVWTVLLFIRHISSPCY